MSICNYCLMQGIKRDAKKKSLKVVTLSSTGMGSMGGVGGVEVHVLKKGEKPSKRNWRGWYMAVTNHYMC